MRCDRCRAENESSTQHCRCCGRVMEPVMEEFEPRPFWSLRRVFGRRRTGMACTSYSVIVDLEGWALAWSAPAETPEGS